MLKGPEFATSIGLLMESLKIRDKKTSTSDYFEEEILPTSPTTPNAEVATTDLSAVVETKEEAHAPQKQTKGNKPTFGQALMEKVKKFFEEVE